MTEAPGHGSLRSDLLAEMLLPMLVVIVLSGYLSYYIGVYFARQSHDRVLFESARVLGENLRVVDGRVQLNLPAALPEILQGDPADGVRFQVMSRQRGLVAGDADLPAGPAEEVSGPQYFSLDGEGETLYGVALYLQHIGDEDIIIRVVENDQRRKELAQDLMAAIIGPQALLLLLAVLAVRAGIRSSLRPLGALEGALHARSAADLSPLPDVGVPSEVRPLTDAVNHLLKRLDAAVGVQQRFVADAAHQLRTPLAALKLQMEQVLREPREQRSAAVLQEMQRGLDRLVRLSNQLLTLARAEPGAGHVWRFQPVDLRALAFEIGMAYVPRALAQGADLGFSGEEEPVMVQGDVLLLGELVRNLLDNALNYGAPRGRITLGVIGGERPVLYVEDDGPGIPEAEREWVFERFHRVPGSPGAGSGLGLAIVRQIALAHDAKLSLDCPPGGGARFSLRFPAAGAVPQGI